MKTRILIPMAICTILFQASVMGAADTLLVHYSVARCDSLIQANATNPDFVVMDVRTPAEYFPEHLEGAINRNYYAPNFTGLLDLLPRNKLYLIHCQSGGRSGATFNMMAAMGFTGVVDMLGGITAWKSASLPTTAAFAPLLMAVSDTVAENDTVVIGTSDTLFLVVTNRANDTLRFTGITSLAGTEFSTDFNISTTLEGPFDYHFSIIYTPVDELADSLHFLIESNGGSLSFHIQRTGKAVTSGMEVATGVHWKVYPNPFDRRLHVENEPGSITFDRCIIYDPLGRVIDLPTARSMEYGDSRITLDAASLHRGVYFIRITGNGEDLVRKIVKW